MENIDDNDLLAGIAMGNYDSFSRLYNQYIRNLTDYGLKFTSDIDLVRDCLHDVFVSLWVRRGDLSIHSSIKSYLIKAVRTSVLKKTSRNRKVQLLHESEEENYSFELAISPEQMVLQTESNGQLAENIQQLLSRLSPKQKEVIYLRYYQNLSFEEIGAQLNMTVNTCYKTMNRAMAELRKTAPVTLILSLLFRQL